MPDDLPQKSQPNLDPSLVRHIAMLNRLGITDAEVQSFSYQFNEIIAYFQHLNEVDTKDVPPANEVPTLKSVMREDVAQPSLPRADFLNNAPHQDGKFVKVPPVFGEE